MAALPWLFGHAQLMHYLPIPYYSYMAMIDNHETATDGWFVYMLRCSDQSLYIGVTNNLERRLREHNGQGSNGARYTRPRRPVALVYSEAAADRQAACQREFALKALKKAEKEDLLLPGS